MKVVVFNGSLHKEGNTSLLLKHVLRKIEEAGIITETLNIVWLIQ